MCFSPRSTNGVINIVDEVLSMSSTRDMLYKPAGEECGYTNR